MIDILHCGRRLLYGQYRSGIASALEQSLPTLSLHLRVGYLPPPRQICAPSTHPRIASSEEVSPCVWELTHLRIIPPDPDPVKTGHSCLSTVWPVHTSWTWPVSWRLGGLWQSLQRQALNEGSLKLIAEHLALSKLVWCCPYCVLRVGSPTHSCLIDLTYFQKCLMPANWSVWVAKSSSPMMPVRRQAITWTNVGLLLIRLLGTNFSEIRCAILSYSFSYKEMHLKISSARIAAVLSYVVLALTESIVGLVCFWSCPG